MKRADKPFANHTTGRYLLGFALVAALLLACERDYQAPPLTEPVYTGAKANITIAQLKTLYANVTDPALIDVDYIIKATVTGNDVSGNIFKQLYIQDETGGINMGVDQNSIFTEYRVGQEIYVRLKGLYMVMYGGQLQIGYGQTNANRIPWEVFNYYVFKDKWPREENVVPKTVKIAQIDQSMVNTLVQLENVYFPDGGKLPFSDPSNTTNRILKDGDGNSIIVRNSNYATFSADMLPEGGGTLVALLSKFNADWQLYIRSIDDCLNFGQPIPGGTTPVDPSVATYYSETFGEGPLPTSPRPLVGNYTGYDNKTVTYSDPSGKTDLRTITALPTPHLWFPTGADSYFVIEGINTSAAAKPLSLTYELALNPYNVGEEMNINAMAVTVDGVAMNVPDQIFKINAASDRNKVFVISLKDVPAKAGLKVEFHARTALNTYGMRLDNISITDAEDVIVITPK